MLKYIIFWLLEPPSFIKKLQSPTVLKKGVSAHFECSLRGTPNIKVTWYKNGDEIMASEKFMMTFDDAVAVLEIIDVILDDSACYICEAQNEAGSESCSTEVEVKGL